MLQRNETGRGKGGLQCSILFLGNGINNKGSGEGRSGVICYTNVISQI